MATVTNNPVQHTDTYDRLRTRNVDVVSSMLLTFVMMVGLAVVILGAMYAVANFKWPEGKLKLEIEQVPGRGDHAAGFARDMEAPGSEEVEEITAPTLEQTLETMTQTLTATMSALDAMDNLLATKGKGGLGDSRPPGPLGEGDTLPRFERWELKFTSRSANGYAAQLDFFNIELGCVGGNVATVDYALKLASKATKRSGDGKDDKRLYFMWRDSNPLVPFEQQLLKKAGVNYNGRVILKFIPDKLQEDLAQLEQRYAMENRGKGQMVPAREFAKTVFECRARRSGGYEWVVIDQRYRKMPALKK